MSKWANKFWTIAGVVILVFILGFAYPTTQNSEPPLRVVTTGAGGGTGVVSLWDSSGLNALYTPLIGGNYLLGNASYTFDGVGNPITSYSISGRQALDVNLWGTSGVPVGFTGTNLNVSLFGGSQSLSALGGGQLKTALFDQNGNGVDASGGRLYTSAGQYGPWQVNSVITNSLGDEVSVNYDPGTGIRSLHTSAILSAYSNASGGIVALRSDINSLGAHSLYVIPDTKGTTLSVAIAGFPDYWLYGRKPLTTQLSSKSTTITATSGNYIYIESVIITNGVAGELGITDESGDIICSDINTTNQFEANIGAYSTSADENIIFFHSASPTGSFAQVKYYIIPSARLIH